MPELRTNELALLTWKEAEEAFAAKPVVLVPMGAVEPHGPQLPLGSDYLVAQHMALEAAKATSSLVTPTIPFGYCDTVRHTPGTISLDLHTLEAVIHDTVSNLALHGVERIVFVNNHRSNAAALNNILRPLRLELGVEMATFFPWGTIIATSQHLYDDFPAVFGHGGEPETSTMLHLHPEHVRMDLAVKDQYSSVWGLKAKGPSQIDFEGAPIDIYLHAEDVTESGTRGDPFAGTAERGEQMTRAAIEKLVAFLEVFKTVPLPA